jgi:hypothetical protein
MFSAVYLVCMMNQPCLFAADNRVYESLDECVHYAELTISNNTLRAQRGEIPPFKAEYQCIGWEKA